VVIVLFTAFVLPAYARHKPDSWARTEFAKAAAMQEALGGRPVAERSRREYEHTIDAYRRVYFGAPASSKAEPSVVASAELMVEMGRRFNDPKALHSAISQYEFLRREYPGSKRRFEALFTIGEIYKDDLGDQAKARATFEDFLKRYPKNHLADKARVALAEPAPPADTIAKHKKQSEADKVAKAGPVESNDSVVQQRKSKTADQPDKNESASTDDNTVASQDSSSDAPSKEIKLARITGIRHWSTPDYTRIAIDLEQDTKFNSQRLTDPERIFFDLKNTRLASTLVGKDLDVNDGLLRKIRVSQYQPKLSRIVLEVGERSTYHAFLLTNPPRLMIDIHGEDPAKKDNSGQPSDDSSGAKISISKESAPPASDERLDAKKQDNDRDIVPTHETKPSGIKRTTTAAGVKKTVVDADDSDDQPDVATVNESIAAKKAPTVKDIPHDEIASLNSSEIADPAPIKARSTKSKAKPTPDFDIHESDPRSDGDRSLIRALGLKIGKIVIDPGHGGHDAGTIGPNGLEEKDVVLDVSRRLGKLLETRLGSEVVYTRKDDTFIPLETRTAVANQEKADLFVSVHANSSHDPDARGVETYYLNFTSSSEALEVAARENAVSEKSIHELQDLVKKIALREKIEESHEFASDVESALHSGLSAKNPGLRNRGVKKAPFIVLIGANMPSILAEISFVSNPGDERRLRNADYRQKIAESLYRGIAKYVSGLNGVKVASRMEKEQPADQ
jgi:N-acetylmuramoyl-L-alanine amidase